MMLPVVNLTEWTDYLEQVAPKDNTESHNYLCVCSRNWSRKWEVLTKDEYDNFFKKNSRWTSSCQKLSLSQIYSISKSLFDKENQVEFKGEMKGIKFQMSSKIAMGSAISSFINVDLNLFAINPEENFKTFNEKLKTLTNSIPRLSKPLTKMANRSSHNHEQERIKGIWGKTKYYIWSWFFDKRPQIKELSEAIPDLAWAKETMIDEIKFRISINMEMFAQCATPLFKMNDPKSSFKEIKIINKNDMEKPFNIMTWFRSYAADKYNYSDKLRPKDIQEANDARIKINTLYQLWKVIIKDEDSKDENSIDNSDRSENSSQLLLMDKE